MNLAAAFQASVAQHAAKPALQSGDRQLTYAQLWAQSMSVARRLDGNLGVQPGDRVGLWLKNSPEFVAAFLGILLRGAVAVPINNFLKPAEVGYLLADAGIDVLITEPGLAPALPELRRVRPGLRWLDVAELEPGAAVASPILDLPHRSEADLAVLIYTSGTTGQPKGAMLSHGNLLHNIESCRIVLRVVQADRFGVILPLFHSYMLTVGTLLPLLIGGAMVLVKALHSPRQLLQELADHQASILPAIPQFFRTLTHSHLEGPLPLRICISGAAPLPAQVLHDFEREFGVPLIEGYGLSEASPVVTKNPLDGRRKPGSIGQPIPNVEVSVQDERGRRLPAGQTGELCVRGGNVMLGYWNRPAETAEVFRDGWLLTGDLGHCDAEGFFYITDRKKDMLLVNGSNVYPREIEECIYQFPGVKEAAVIGRPDPRKGEQPLAYVVPAAGVHLDEAELLAFLRARLADYKVPRQAIFLAALPRNPTGKVLKTALRQLADGPVPDASGTSFPGSFGPPPRS